jgi:hypothetical protein
MLLACGGAAFAATQLFKPKDLGVVYTEADYQSAVTKLGVQKTDTVPDLPPEKTKTVYKGKKKVKAALSSSEVSALVSMHRRSPGQPLQNVQILLGDNNTLQMTGSVVYNGVSYPFYTALTAALAGPQAVGGSAQSIVVWGVELPREYYEAATEFLASAINTHLAEMGDSLDIQSASIVGGELVFEGTIPATAEGVPLDGVSVPAP